MSIVFPDNLDTLTNPVSTDTLDSPSHAGQHSDLNDAVEALEAKVGADGSAVTTSHDYQIGAGWIPAGETWTYASADDPTYTFTISGDLSAKYSAGMRIKLTQTTAKYFIITKVAYVDPNTTITVYGGTDYDLASATITSPYYSMVKAPQGFPLDPDKWSVEVTASTSTIETSITTGTYYNVGSLSISIPIGSWKVTFKGVSGVDDQGGDGPWCDYGLSSSNSSFAENFWKFRLSVTATGSTRVYPFISFCHTGVINKTSKGTHYVLFYTNDADVDTMGLRGDTGTTYLIATCAYL